jgi:hypothetical protein
VTAAIETERAVHHIPAATSCRALGASESWFYKHRGRPPTPTQARRAELDAAIREVFEDNDGTYGSPRVHAELIERPEWAQLSVNAAGESFFASLKTELAYRVVLTPKTCRLPSQNPTGTGRSHVRVKASNSSTTGPRKSTPARCGEEAQLRGTARVALMEILSHPLNATH